MNNSYCSALADRVIMLSAVWEDVVGDYPVNRSQMSLWVKKYEVLMILRVFRRVAAKVDKFKRRGTPMPEHQIASYASSLMFQLGVSRVESNT